MRRGALLALALLLACGGDATGPSATASGAVGIWKMYSVDGNVLPYAMAPNLQLASSTLRIESSGRWSEILILRYTNGYTDGQGRTEIADTGSGYWTMSSPSTVAFQCDDGPCGTSSLIGPTLSTTSQGTTYVYKRG